MKSQKHILPSNIKIKYVQNDNVYSKEELILFHDTVCGEVQLKTISIVLELFKYDHELLKIFIAKSAIHDSNQLNFLGIFKVKVTDSSKEYHKNLFDIMYIRKLDELPLLINNDKDLKPIILWRFKIGK